MNTIDTMRDTLHNPEQLVADWKAQGKKIVGYRCIYVPEEIIWAAGMWPYPIFGTPEAITQADSYFQPCTCEFIRNIFDHALDGKLNFLDGLVLCNTCDAVRHLYDMWITYIKVPDCHIINNPQKMYDESGYKYYCVELKRFKSEMENLSGNGISDESLQSAINLYNQTRGLLKELYSLRKKDPPLISGGEALDIVMASMLMPKDKCNQQLQQLIAEVKTRESPKTRGPRILITGSIIDDPTLIQLVEEVGGVVVADDLCTTTKYFWQEVGQNKDPLDALSRYNTERCLCSCMHPPERRFDYLWELIEEFGANGVIYFNLKYCHPFLYEAALFREKLAAKDVPTLMLEVDHSLSGLGQLRTRIQAFIEML